MEGLSNLDLLAVGVAVTATGIVGLVTFLSDRENATNKSFLLFAILTIFWGVANFASHKTLDATLALWLLRIAVFFAVWHAFSFFHLAYIFPAARARLPKKYFYSLLPVAGLTSLITLTPLVFQGVVDFSLGRATEVENGPAIALFSAVVFSMIGAAFALFIKKFIRAERIQRQQFRYALIGAGTTFALLLTFNFVFPAFLDDARFIPFGGVFLLPFAFFTGYAIIKHQLFSVKVVATEILTFVLAITILLQVILSDDLSELLLEMGIFTLVLVFGFLLIQGVRKEVESRRKIQELADDLGKANERLKELDKLKSEFLSFATHQLRAPLTAVKGYSSLIIEGTFGEVGPKVKEAAERIFQSAQSLIHVVEDFLNISRIEQGRMQYNFSRVDFKELVEQVVNQQEANANSRGLELVFEETEEADYHIRIDREKVRQVIMNIIDNAIKYTEKGSVAVKLVHDKKERKVRLIVRDTGIGVPEKVRPQLFKKFSRSKGGEKANIRGTGLGLYLAKEIVNAHHGKIWVESEGEGKGSTFFIEFYTDTIVGS